MREIRVIGAVKTAQAKKRTAAYCRVSSDSADQLASYRAQVSRYTTLIGENPEWEFAGIYADEGLTGTRADTRDDFQRMMRDCGKGKIDRILVKSISRFARNTQDCLEAVRQLRIMGVSVFFEKENIDTADMTSEMLLCVHSAGAQQESISISENMRWSYKHRMERGEFITCSAPYGYRLDRRDLVIYEPEATIIRRIFEEYLSGKSKRQIADGLSADEIKKHAGSTLWRSSDITHLLCNEKYAGDAVLQKTYTTDTLPFRSVINRGEVERYHVQNSHPAIINRERYELARELAAKRKTPRSRQEQYTFSKRIACIHCGSSMKRREQNEKITWTCYRHHQNRDLCPILPIPEPHIQDAFVHMWNKLLQNRQYIIAPLLSGLRELDVKFTADPEQFSALNKEIAELTGQSVILNQLRGKGYLDDAMFTQQIDALNGKLDVLRLRRRSLLKHDEDNPALTGIQTLAEIMESAEPLFEFCGDAFESIVDKVIANNEMLRFRLKGGLELFEYMHGKGGRAR